MASVKEVLKASGGSVAEKLLIPPSLIDVEDGFNVRIPGRELDEHIDGLASLIKLNGFDPTQPISVSRNGDRFVVRSGHCRFTAVKRLLSIGEQILTIPALLEPQGTNNVDRAYQIGTQNGQKPLTELEYGVLIKRQRGYGQTDDQIMAGFGKTRAWLSRVMDLAGASSDVHRAVVERRISATEAVNVVRRHGEDAGAVIGAAVDHAKSENRKRARPRDVAAVTIPIRKERVSLCSLAMAVVRADDDDDIEAVRAAISALRTHLGPLVMAA